MTLTELHGGPLDGRIVATEHDLIVCLRGEQHRHTVTHWYALDGRYLGAYSGARRSWWARLCGWWNG